MWADPVRKEQEATLLDVTRIFFERLWWYDQIVLTLKEEAT
jgi:hypothetical protein